MNVRVLTLFDDEPIVPQAAVVKKKRAAKPVPVKEEVSVAALEERPTPNTISVRQPVKSTIHQGEKNYYSIGETAKLFKVRTSHIRFWTVQFGMKVRTTRKGDRLFTPENIEHLKVIHHLVKEQGFTIAGAKSKLKELKQVNVAGLQKNELLSRLCSIKETLIYLRNQI
jgi:DNA-binding transcriptional MerR regulator